MRKDQIIYVTGKTLLDLEMNINNRLSEINSIANDEKTYTDINVLPYFVKDGKTYVKEIQVYQFDRLSRKYPRKTKPKAKAKTNTKPKNAPKPTPTTTDVKKKRTR